MADFVSGSHSRIEAFKQCPKKFYHQSVAKGADKVAYVQSEEAKTGDTIHKLLDANLKHGTSFPVDYAARLEPLAAAVKQGPGTLYSEVELTVDRNLTPCGSRDWDRAYIRMIVDVLKIDGTTAWGGDWKTGKRNFDESQLALSAAGIFVHFPQVDTVATSYIWIGEKDIDKPKVYTRDQLDALWSEPLQWMNRIQEAKRTNSWPARPTKFGPPFCAYCSTNKAGLCKEAGAPPRKS